MKLINRATAAAAHVCSQDENGMAARKFKTANTAATDRERIAVVRAKTRKAVP